MAAFLYYQSKQYAHSQKHIFPAKLALQAFHRTIGMRVRVFTSIIRNAWIDTAKWPFAFLHWSLAKYHSEVTLGWH